LFDNPKITRRIGDAYDEVETFAEERFSRIIHDPPMFSLAGHLYATEFYRELYRILTPKGRLFHYIGNPASKSGGNVTRGVVRRLQEAGFRRIKPRPQAFGVVAYK
jgi:predicted methyltransferase